MHPKELLLILASGERQLGKLPPLRNEDNVFSLFLRQVLLDKAQRKEVERIKRHLADVLRTEYARLNYAAQLSEERIEGDIGEVLRTDMCPVVPQCLSISGKSYVQIIAASAHNTPYVS